MAPTNKNKEHAHIGFEADLVTAERSMFGTRLPRPTGVGPHLIVVALAFGVALAIAIFFAERPPVAEKAVAAPAEAAP